MKWIWILAIASTLALAGCQEQPPVAAEPYNPTPEEKEEMRASRVIKTIADSPDDVRAGYLAHQVGRNDAYVVDFARKYVNDPILANAVTATALSVSMDEKPQMPKDLLEKLSAEWDGMSQDHKTWSLMALSRIKEPVGVDLIKRSLEKDTTAMCEQALGVARAYEDPTLDQAVANFALLPPREKPSATIRAAHMMAEKSPDKVGAYKRVYDAHTDAEVRLQMALALSQENDRHGMDALKKGLGHKERMMRFQSLAALVDLGEKPDATVEKEMHDFIRTTHKEVQGAFALLRRSKSEWAKEMRAKAEKDLAAQGKEPNDKPRPRRRMTGM